VVSFSQGGYTEAMAARTREQAPDRSGVAESRRSVDAYAAALAQEGQAEPSWAVTDCWWAAWEPDGTLLLTDDPGASARGLAAALGLAAGIGCLLAVRGNVLPAAMLTAWFSLGMFWLAGRTTEYRVGDNFLEARHSFLSGAVRVRRWLGGRLVVRLARHGFRLRASVYVVARDRPHRLWSDLSVNEARSLASTIAEVAGWPARLPASAERDD
jgi:hypothetical protein